MDPIRKIPKKVTKKFVNKVINRQYFHRKTGLYLSRLEMDYYFVAIYYHTINYYGSIVYIEGRRANDRYIFPFSGHSNAFLAPAQNCADS